MPGIFVQRFIELPLIGTWKWTEDDYKNPLVFELTACRCSLFLHGNSKLERSVVTQGRILFEFPNPPMDWVRGLRTSQKLAAQVADQLYSLYRQVHEQFELALRTGGNTVSLMRIAPMTYETFFREEVPGWGIRWWREGESPQPFRLSTLSKRRGLNPLFKRREILTTRKWKKIQSALASPRTLSSEVLDLLRIRAMAQWRMTKVATIEAAILVESMLREYVENVMTRVGFSKTKLKAFQDDLSFGAMLNVVLPLSLTKAETRRVKEWIQGVDVLRRIRNDLVHGNRRENEIDEANVRRGIDASLKLVDFISRKLPKRRDAKS